MKPEDIKVGDCHPVLAHVGYKNKKGNYGITINWGDGEQITKSLTPAEVCAMFSVCELKPKYDPCRKLKVGDVVRVLKINGNLPKCKWAGNIPKEGVTGIVRDLREGDHFVWIDFKEIVCYCIDPAYLELVTPVEELEPYFVMELKGGYGVYNTRFQPETEACHYWNDMHPHAKEAAEDERDRLNAEYRKEQEK